MSEILKALQRLNKGSAMNRKDAKQLQLKAKIKNLNEKVEGLKERLNFKTKEIESLLQINSKKSVVIRQMAKLEIENEKLKKKNREIELFQQMALILRQRIQIFEKQNEDLKAKNLKLQDEVYIYEIEAEKHREVIENEKLKRQAFNKEKKSQNIAGWTIAKGKDGFYRARKTIEKKTHTVYVGKQIQESVVSKLKEREKAIHANLEQIVQN